MGFSITANFLVSHQDERGEKQRGRVEAFKHLSHTCTKLKGKIMSQNDASPKLSRRTLIKQSAAAATAIAALNVTTAHAAPNQASSLLAAPKMQDRETILHWSHPLSDDDNVVFDPIIKRFQDAGNNIDVKVELIPWDGRIERKMSAAAAGTSPDASYLNVDEFTTYAVEGALVPLDEYVTPESLADFLPGPRDAMTWEDKIYEIPVLHAFRVAFYNTAVWKTSGLDVKVTPEAWDDLDADLATILKAKDAGSHKAWPTAMEGSGSGPTPVLRNFNPWFYQAGGQLIADDGSCGYDSAAGIEAATYATHQFQSYCSPADRASKGEDLNERFGQGQIAYLNNQEMSVINIMAKDFPELQYGVASTTEKVKKWTHGGVGNFGMWTPSKKRDATWSWIDFLTSAGNLEYTKGFGFAPPRTSVRKEYIVDLDSLHTSALAQQEYAGVEKHPRLWDMWDIVSPELQAAFAGLKTPEEAVKTAADRINKDILKS
jgi:multiple sugar transport system substrate-binding protein